MSVSLAFLTPQLSFLFLFLLILLLLSALLVAKKFPIRRLSARFPRWLLHRWTRRHTIRAQLEISRQQHEETRQQLLAAQAQLKKANKQISEMQEKLTTRQDKLRATPRNTDAPETLLQNTGWLTLVQECITLFDALETQSAGMDSLRQEVAGYTCSQLEEILERCGVSLISGDTAFDERRHRPSPAIRRVASGVRIEETLSPGFVVGPRVLRRARVRLAQETR